MKSFVSMDDLYTCKPGKIWQQLKNEHLSFWFLCMYLFFEYVRPQSIYKSLDFFPWAFFCISLAFLLSFAEKGRNKSGNIINKLLVIYAVIVFLSGVFAVNSDISFDNFWYFYNWIFIFFVIVRIVTTRQRFFIFFLLNKQPT